MPHEITIAVEGRGADGALAELLAIDGLQGSLAPTGPDAPTRDGGVLVAVGIIVGIVGGIVTITDKIIAWRDALKANAENQRLSVIIEDARGNRLPLANATPAQISAILQTLSR